MCPVIDFFLACIPNAMSMDTVFTLLVLEYMPARTRGRRTDLIRKVENTLLESLRPVRDPINFRKETLRSSLNSEILKHWDTGIDGSSIEMDDILH